MSFHVPEFARDQTHPILATTAADGCNGAFHLDSPEPGWSLAIIVSDGGGWEHVSVHAYRVQRIEVVGLLGRGSPVWRERAHADVEGNVFREARILGRRR